MNTLGIKGFQKLAQDEKETLLRIVNEHVRPNTTIGMLPFVNLSRVRELAMGEICACEACTEVKIMYANIKDHIGKWRD